MDHGPNVTAYFKDIATRHPNILHDDATNKKFRELEWDELIQEGGALGLPGFFCILEDYNNNLSENDNEYPVINPTIALLIVRHYTAGSSTDKMAAFTEAEAIAFSITYKVRKDAENGGCEADVPTGVRPPRALEFKGSGAIRIQPPMWLHSAGVRLTLKLRYDIPLKDYAITWPAL